MTTYEPESEWFRDNGQGLCTPLFMRRCADFTYVDLGCAHPVNKSLTAICRDLGWNGLAIDANQDYANDWAEAGFGRHFMCAVLSDQPTARFAVHENAFTSRISESEATDHREKWGIERIEQRSTVPLNHLLEVNGMGQIALLTVDLEGHEFAVLQTLDFAKHDPLFIIAEFNTAGAGVDPRVCNFLLERGYEVVHMTESNLIYRKK